MSYVLHTPPHSLADNFRPGANIKSVHILKLMGQSAAARQWPLLLQN